MIRLFKEQFDTVRRAADGYQEEIKKAEEAQKEMDLVEHGFVPKIKRQEDWVKRHERRQDDQVVIKEGHGPDQDPHISTIDKN